MRLYFELDGEKRRLDICCFSGCTKKSAINEIKRVKPHLSKMKVLKVLIKDTWDEMEDSHGLKASHKVEND